MCHVTYVYNSYFIFYMTSIFRNILLLRWWKMVDLLPSLLFNQWTNLQHHAGSGAHLMPGRSGCRTATPGGPSWVRTCKRRGPGCQWWGRVVLHSCMIWYEKLFPRKLRCPLKKGKVGRLKHTFLLNWPLFSGHSFVFRGYITAGNWNSLVRKGTYCIPNLHDFGFQPFMAIVVFGWCFFKSKIDIFAEFWKDVLFEKEELKRVEGCYTFRCSFHSGWYFGLAMGMKWRNSYS